MKFHPFSSLSERATLHISRLSQEAVWRSLLLGALGVFLVFLLVHLILFFSLPSQKSASPQSLLSEHAVFMFQNDVQQAVQDHHTQAALFLSYQEAAPELSLSRE